MSLNYLDIIAKHRENTSDHAASPGTKKAPVLYRGGASKKNRLTKAKARRSLKLSTAGRPRGKSRNSVKNAPTQEATAMAKKSGSKSKKKKKSTGPRFDKVSKSGAAKAKKAAKKAAATRKRNEAKRSAAGKKAAATRKRNAGKAAAPKKKAAKRKSSKKARKSGTRKSGRARSTHTTRTEIIRLPGHTTKLAVVPVPSMARRSKPRKAAKRKKSSKKKKSGKGKAKEAGYAMENPLSGTELFVGGLTLLAGFLVADVNDRYWATHALTDKNAKDAAGNELYADAPPADGNYAGLFNATAVLAPYDWKRWAAGAVGTAAPFIIAAFVKAPTGRSALQFFGFGFGARFLGKALIDLVAMATKKTKYGQQFYDAEMRAASMKAGANGYPLSSLPSTGLGAPGCGCANCSTGIGACCGYVSPSSQAPSPPPPPPPASGPTTQQQPMNPPPATGAPTRAFAPALNPPAAVHVDKSTGAAGVPVKKNPFNWGYDDAAE